MLTPLARAFLLTLALLTVTVARGAEPPADKPTEAPYTAFPDLKPRPFGPDDPNLIPVLPPLPADASPLRKVQHAQAYEGLRYLVRMKAAIRIDSWSSQSLFDAVRLSNEVYAIAAAGEDTPANTIPWYEERIRTLKTLEEVTETRLQKGFEPVHRLHYVRFFRLQAEHDLLALKETAKAGDSTSRPLAFKKPEAMIIDPKQQPAKVTAFPKLQPRRRELKTITKPGGATEMIYEEKGVIPLPPLLELPPRASALRKVRDEQVREGFDYLHTSRPTPPPLLDIELPAYQFLYYFRNSAETYKTAAQLEAHAADRIPWYEARVRWLKLAEVTMFNRVVNGVVPAWDFDAARFYRLQTEADLLQLQARIAKAGPATRPAPARERSSVEEQWGFHDVKPRPYFTAVPDPATVEVIEVKRDKDEVQTYRRDKGEITLPPLPAVEAHAAPVSKTLNAQVREGLACLDQMHQLKARGQWNGYYFPEYLHMATEAYRAAAQLEATPATQIPWHLARVRTLKQCEWFTELRAANGTAPRSHIHDVRVQRLRAEAELLALKDEAAKPAPAAVVVPVVVCPMPYPPVCVRPRGGLLPRLFHRR